MSFSSFSDLHVPAGLEHSVDKLQADLDPSALLISGRRPAPDKRHSLTASAWFGRATPFQNTSKAFLLPPPPLAIHSWIFRFSKANSYSTAHAYRWKSASVPGSRNPAKDDEHNGSMESIQSRNSIWYFISFSWTFCLNPPIY